MAAVQRSANSDSQTSDARARLEGLWEERGRELEQIMGRYLYLEAALSHSPDEILRRQSESDTARTRAEQVRAELDEIEAALLRIDDGTYGSCVRCGQSIGAERLEVLPAASRCALCDGRIDRD